MNETRTRSGGGPCHICGKRGFHQENVTLNCAGSVPTVMKWVCDDHRPPLPTTRGEWRDIATAPKDGTWVLLGVAGDQSDNKGGNSPIVGYFNFQWGWLTLPGRYTATPTHWQPLPAPPKGETP